jgi:hypothetical protein
MDEGIVSLSVHDSFLVQAPHRTLLEKTTEGAFEMGLREAKRLLGPKLRQAGLCGNGLTLRSSLSAPARPRRRSLTQLIKDRARRMLAELEKIQAADPRPLDSRIRLAAIALGTLYPLSNDLSARTAAFFAHSRCTDAGDLWHTQLGRVVAEVEARGHFRISTRGAVRLAAAPLHLADALGLELLKPPTPDMLTRTQRSNLKRRLKRQARRKSPRIVNLQRARPWELEQVSRATWYARHRNRHEHQLLGLHSLLLRGDAAAVADAQREITLRAQSSQSQVLKQMQRLLERPDLKDASPCPFPD